MNLRDYQRAAIDIARDALPRRPVLVAPTGAGKTVMGASLVRELNVPTLWIAHRKELVEQGARQLEALGLATSIIMASYRGSYLGGSGNGRGGSGGHLWAASPVHVASIQTLVRREMPKPVELIVIDECHHAVAGSYAEVFEEYPGVPVLGLTATPFRLDGKGLGDIFGEIVVAATTRQLCEQGTLHKPKVYSQSRPDLSKVRITAGEYNLRQLDNAINTPQLVGDIVSTWRRLAPAQRTVVFATSIQHSQAVVAAFQAAGVAAEHLDGSTPTVERDAILRRLRHGETTVVSNCMVLTEGWDLPALQCAIIARPTASLCLHLQMVGRIMRAADGKDGAVVLDHAGNHHRHGAVTRRIVFTLEGVDAAKSEPLGLKLCPGCYLMVETDAAACPECGYVFASSLEDAGESREVEVADGELEEFDEDSHDYRAAMWEQFEAERAMAGFKPGWSAYRYKERFGEWPVVVEDRLIDPAHATIEDKRAVFLQIEERRKQYNHQPGWTSHRYREIFGVWPRGFVSEARGPLAGQEGESGREQLISSLNARWAAGVARA